MSKYQVLARKWRPHNFETIVGQDHVVTALTRALTQGRLHHAYLFTGTRGVGKTTISRIFAKALNCVGPDGRGGVTASPCGVCPACKAIDAGNFNDYIEMDAASNRSVEDMTALLEQSLYAPTEGRYKVYMIDEVHMLSNTAFNAMLKTLEEPPEYVKFILATTDPQKVPITVLSRCLQFNLRNMTPTGIVEHMAHILDAEGIAYERPGLRLLALGARGSMRDGLSLLDQAIAYCAEGVTEAEVRHMLGMSGTQVLAAIFEALAQGDARAMLAQADSMLSSSVSFAQALRDMASLWHRAALEQRVSGAVGADDPEREMVCRIAESFEPEEVQLNYQIALQGRNDLSMAPDEYAGFTMTLLRMLAFKPAGSKAGALPIRSAPETTPTVSAAVPSGAAASEPPVNRTAETARPTAAASEPPPWERDDAPVNRAAETARPTVAASEPPPWEPAPATGVASVGSSSGLPPMPRPTTPPPGYFGGDDRGEPGAG